MHCFIKILICFLEARFVVVVVVVDHFPTNYFHKYVCTSC